MERVTMIDERFVWVARDKGSEWKTIHSLQYMGELPFRLLVEAVCEPFIPNRKGLTLTPNTVASRLARNLAKASMSGPVWIDFGNLTALRTFSGADIALMLDLLRVHAEAGGWGHLIVPVVRTTSELSMVNAVARWAARLDSGICIRVMGANGLAAKATFVNAVLESSGLDHNQIDLVIDAQDLPSVASQQQLADAFALSQSSRTWAIIAGTFPSAVTHLSADDYIHLLPRTEWMEFSSDRSLGSGKRTPLYGDYATQGSLYAPSPGFGASATIRYTAGDDYLVLRGHGGTKADFKQYIGHARFLVAHASYRDVTGSPAEAYIEKIARGESGTGNATTWRVASLQRHLSVVAAQWAAHLAIRPLVHVSV